MSESGLAAKPNRLANSLLQPEALTFPRIRDVRTHIKQPITYAGHAKPVALVKQEPVPVNVKRFDTLTESDEL